MRVLLRIFIALDIIALVPALILLIPAGMLFDGGYTAKTWFGFTVLATIPVALIAGLLFGVRFQRQENLPPALLALTAPLAFAVVALSVLAAL